MPADLTMPPLLKLGLLHFQFFPKSSIYVSMRSV
jgi:hypothetical protein